MVEVHFKDELDVKDLHRMKPHILMVLVEYIDWCRNKALPCVISSLKEDVPGRRSSTHCEGRAFDASVRHWGDDAQERDELAAECEEFFNNKYSNLGTAPRGRPPVVCVYHENAGQEHIEPEKRRKHLHFQVRRS